MMAKKMNGASLVRMDDALIKRIDKYREKLAAQTGLPVTFSAAVRLLVEKGLEAK